MAPMKVAVAVVLGVLVVLGVSQLVIPGVVESRIEDQLEEGVAEGQGEASVEVSAFPAVRLAWGSGDKLQVRGRGLRVDLAERADDPLGRINGFDEVDIDLEDMVAGPVRVQAFSLVRTERDTSYYLRMEAETTPLALAESVGGSLGGDIGSQIAQAGAALLGGGEIDVPIDVEAQVSRGDGGAVDVDAAEANVAGVPAGPFAETMVQAVLNRL